MNRVRFKRVWRRIHQVNYTIFIALSIKALMIGIDLELTPALRVLYYIFIAAAVAGFLYRMRRYIAAG